MPRMNLKGSSSIVTGGASEYANNLSPENYISWAEGIKEGPVLVDFEKGSLQPIWKLANDTERQTKIEAAFLKLCEKHPLPEAPV